MAGDEEASTSDRRPRAQIQPRPDLLLIVCRCFNVLTGLVALLCVIVNVLSAVRSFRNGSDIFGGIFRCYAVVIALFVAALETEWSFLFKFWRVLEYWVGRGMLQIFLAVMTRAFPDVSVWRKDLVLLLQDIASYLLMACGLTYVLSGILCIGFLKRARQHKKITREQAAKDFAATHGHLAQSSRLQSHPHSSMLVVVLRGRRPRYYGRWIPSVLASVAWCREQHRTRNWSDVGKNLKHCWLRKGLKISNIFVTYVTEYKPLWSPLLV